MRSARRTTFIHSMTVASAGLSVPKPSPGGSDPNRTKFTYYAGVSRLAETAAPNTKNVSHRITAVIDMPAGGEGVISQREACLLALRCTFRTASSSTTTTGSSANARISSRTSRFRSASLTVDDGVRLRRRRARKRRRGSHRNQRQGGGPGPDCQYRPWSLRHRHVRRGSDTGSPVSNTYQAAVSVHRND